MPNSPSSTDSKTVKQKPLAGPHRSSARLSAVQALYEIEITAAPVSMVLAEFKKNRWKDTADGGDGAIVRPNFALFRRLVRGVTENTKELDVIIAPALAKNMVFDNFEALLKTILRAASYEMSYGDKGVPAFVIISEYVDITHAFFGPNETNMVNGILGNMESQLE